MAGKRYKPKSIMLKRCENLKYCKGTTGKTVYKVTAEIGSVTAGTKV